MERPPFAADFPEDAELDRLVEAFNRGDYRAVRAGTSALANHADENVRRAARELRARTNPDPLAAMLLVFTLLLLAWLTFHWERHDGRRNLEPDRHAPASSSSR